jgi:heat shock protein HspQ
MIDEDRLVADIETRFQNLVGAAALKRRWEVADLQGKYARLSAKSSLGVTKVCHVFNVFGSVGFIVRSDFEFSAAGMPPQDLSTELLKRNDSNTFGYWCLEEADGGFYYSCMREAQLQHLDADDFVRCVDRLLDECSLAEEELGV